MTAAAPRRALLMLAVACGSLAVAGSADAAVNPTSTSVVCSPLSVATGTATSCTVTVTDTGASARSDPTGAVTFYSAPSTAGFSDSGGCTPAPGASASSSCTVTFTGARGGSYTVSADFAGDAAHSASAATTGVTVVDATATSISCDATNPPINTDVICTATLTDGGSPQAPVGEVGFTANPATGNFASPSQCPWTPADSGMGGSATCQATFTATAAGTYTLTAGYGGDSTHAASAGTTLVTVTTALTDGGPGASNPGGLSLPIGSTEPTAPVLAPGTVRIVVGTIKVSTHRVAGVHLACSGSRGATCSGILTLTAPIKVKVKKKVRVKTKSHTKTVTKTVTVARLLKLGSVVYTVRAGKKPAVSVTLSKRAYALLTKAARRRLKVSASTAGVARTLVLTSAQKPKKAKKKKAKAKHKAKTKPKHR